MKVISEKFGSMDNNCSLIIDEKTNQSALVDCNEFSQKMIDMIGDTDLKYILLTHGHFDHVGSAEALRRKYHAVLYCEADDLAGDKMYPLSEADHGYAEGQTVTVDELQFTAWHTPGHTPGSVVLLCGEYLFCGDTLFAGSIGRTDAMNASLRKLAKLPIPRETQVLPGHGEFSTFGEELDNNYFIRSALRGNADF